MELNEQNLELLSTYLRKTFSPNGDERSEGKIEKGFCLSMQRKN